MPALKEKYDCALVLANDLIGGKWKTIILWHIMHGENRFSMLKKAIPQISEKMLYTMLKELEESGLIEKEVIEDKPPKVIVYELHREQKELKVVIQSICEFSESYATNKKISLN